jgi:hypothetical protein
VLFLFIPNARVHPPIRDMSILSYTRLDHLDRHDHHVPV